MEMRATYAGRSRDRLSRPYASHAPMLGRPAIRSVYAQMSTQVHAAKTRGDDNAILILEFENGVTCVAEESWTKLGGMDDRAKRGAKCEKGEGPRVHSRLQRMIAAD